MDKYSIMKAIRDRVESTKTPSYSAWRIGLTHDPDDRTAEWGDREYWLEWEADSLMDAQDIESHFINLDMKGGTGGNLTDGRRVWVYIF